MLFKLYRSCYQKLAQGDSRELQHTKNMLNIYILTLVRAYIDQRYTLEQHDYEPAQVKNRNQMKGQDPEHLHIGRLNTLI